MEPTHDQAFNDFCPIKALKCLQAAIGYNDGYVIYLGKNQNAYLYRLLRDTIAFHDADDLEI
jgi:hypothetical protein